MTTETVRSRAVDQPVFFPPDTGTYFGIVSVPPSAATPSPTAVLLLSGTHTGSTTMGRNRMWVTIGRTLAERGHYAMRLDYAGLGESLPGGPIYDLERPAVDAFHHAIAHLRSFGVERVVVVGTCYGSRTVLAGSVDTENISGILLLAPPVRNPVKGEGGTAHLALYASTGDLAKRAFSFRTIRKLLRVKQARHVARKVVTGKVQATMGRGPAKTGDARASATDPAPGFVGPLRALTERGIPIRIVFGEDDIFWTEFQRAAEGRMGRLLDQAGVGVDVRTVPGVVRGFTSLRIQEVTADEILDWVGECDR